MTGLEGARAEVERRAAADPVYAEKLAALVDWSKAKAVGGALVSSLVAGLIVLWAVIPDGLTGQEWIEVALAFLGSPGAVGATVYRTNNRARRKTPPA